MARLSLCTNKRQQSTRRRADFEIGQARLARVEQAKANLKQRQLEANSVKELANRGLSNESQQAQAQTLLANAQAELTAAQIQLDATQVRAPLQV